MAAPDGSYQQLPGVTGSYRQLTAPNSVKDRGFEHFFFEHSSLFRISYFGFRVFGIIRAIRVIRGQTHVPFVPLCGHATLFKKPVAFKIDPAILARSRKSRELCCVVRPDYVVGDFCSDKHFNNN